MSTVITTAGEQLIAQKIGAGAVLSIDTIILAHIPDLDLDSPVDREQGKPQPENVVHEYAIPEDFKGYVNPNQVVYSMLLGSEIGNFQFNWLGLYSSADDVLIAVTHLPVTQKWQTDKGSNTLGNNLTRNFMLEFSGAKAVTNITVEAKTWQVDFTARLRSIDERERLNNRDIYGRSCFFNDGFSIVKAGSSYVLKAGAGYVEGIRCVQSEDTALVVSTLPTCVFLDVSLQQRGSDVVPVVTPLVAGGASDYVGANNVSHYCIKLAGIDAGGVVWDDRRVEAVATDLVEYLKKRIDDHANHKDDPHSTVEKVKELLTSSVTSTSATMFATPRAVKTVWDLIVEHIRMLSLHVPDGGSTGHVLTKTSNGHMWQKANGGAQRMNIVRFTSSGTYNKPANLIYAEVYVTGGGSAGGQGNSRGGSAGGTAIKVYAAHELNSAEAVRVGAGGVSTRASGGMSSFKNMKGMGGVWEAGEGGASGGDINLHGSGGGGASRGGTYNDGGAGGASYWGGGGAAAQGNTPFRGFHGSGGASNGEKGGVGGHGGNGLIVIKEFLKG